jgi:hypothetical protein
MAFIPKEGNGSLFKNDKGDNPARPDYRGDAMVNGEHVEISAWLKPLPSDPSKRYMSLSFKPKQPPQAAPQPTPRKPSSDAARSRYPAERQAPQRDEFDDGSSIPF